MLWLEHLTSINANCIKLVEFDKWLGRKAEVACKLQIPNLSEDRVKEKNRILATKNPKEEKFERKSDTCGFCNEGTHVLHECKQFKLTDCQQKYIVSKKLCFSCLHQYQYGIGRSNKRKMCGIDGCNKSHHPLLQEEKQLESVSPILPTEINIYHSCREREVILKILPVIVRNGNREIYTFALLDDGSTVSLTDDDLAQLNLDGPQRPLVMQWTGEEIKEDSTSRIVSFSIKGVRSSKYYDLRRVRTTRKLSLPSQTIHCTTLLKRYPYLEMSKINSFENAKPLLLIGQDNWPLLVNKKIIGGSWSGPVLSQTLLGCVLHRNSEFEGKMSITTKEITCHVSGGEKDDLDVLHDLVKEQWKLDLVVTTPSQLEKSV